MKSQQRKKKSIIIFLNERETTPMLPPTWTMVLLHFWFGLQAPTFPHGWLTRFVSPKNVHDNRVDYMRVHQKSSAKKVTHPSTIMALSGFNLGISHGDLGKAFGLKLPPVVLCILTLRREMIIYVICNCKPMRQFPIQYNDHNYLWSLEVPTIRPCTSLPIYTHDQRPQGKNI